MNRTKHAPTIALVIFAVNMIGRTLGRFYDSIFAYDIGVAICFVIAYAYFYYLTTSALNKLIVSALFGYTITSSIKEIVFDPTRIYPIEYLSVIPVVYTLVEQWKKLKAPATHKTKP